MTKQSNLYRLLLPFPGHLPGDLLYKYNQGERGDAFLWCQEPRHRHEVSLVESSPNFFEPVFHDWENGEHVFFFNPTGILTEQYFDLPRHAGYVVTGGAHRSKAAALAAQERMRQALDTSTVFWSREDLDLLKHYLQTADLDNAIKLVNTKI